VKGGGRGRRWAGAGTGFFGGMQPNESKTSIFTKIATSFGCSPQTIEDGVVAVDGVEEADDDDDDGEEACYLGASTAVTAAVAATWTKAWSLQRLEAAPTGTGCGCCAAYNGTSKCSRVQSRKSFNAMVRRIA